MTEDGAPCTLVEENVGVARVFNNYYYNCSLQVFVCHESNLGVSSDLID